MDDEPPSGPPDIDGDIQREVSTNHRAATVEPGDGSSTAMLDDAAEEITPTEAEADRGAAEAVPAQSDESAQRPAELQRGRLQAAHRVADQPAPQPSVDAGDAAKSATQETALRGSDAGPAAESLPAARSIASANRDAATALAAKPALHPAADAAEQGAPDQPATQVARSARAAPSVGAAAAAAAAGRVEGRREPAEQSTTSHRPNRSARAPRRSAIEISAARQAPRADASVDTAGAVTAAVAKVADIAALAGEPAPLAELADDSSQISEKPAPQKVEAASLWFGRSQRLGDATSRAGRPETSEVPRIDPERFIGRVARAFHTAQERGGVLQLRLSPPELGSLRLELSLQEGVLTASLETETAAARRLLLEHLPALRDRLAEQSIRVERFDVDVRRDGGGSQAEQRNAHYEPHDRSPDQSHGQPEQRRRAMAAPADETPVLQDSPAQPLANSGINLIV